MPLPGPGVRLGEEKALRNLVIGYMAFVVIFICIWYAIIPTYEELVEREAETRFATVVRALESEILSRYSGVEREGNMTIIIHTYHSANVTRFELYHNQTRMTLYFVITSQIRVKKFGLIIDEYPGANQSKSIQAYLEEDYWHLNTSSIKDMP